MTTITVKEDGTEARFTLNDERGRERTLVIRVDSRTATVSLLTVGTTNNTEPIATFILEHNGVVSLHPENNTVMRWDDQRDSFIRIVDEWTKYQNVIRAINGRVLQ